MQVDNLNIRKRGQYHVGCRGTGPYKRAVRGLDQVDGWVQIPSGYMSADCVKLEYALNEARKLDLKAMIFNMYKNIGISDVDNYLNVREEPSEDGKVIAQDCRARRRATVSRRRTTAGTRSSPVQDHRLRETDYILTGQAAKDEALKVAELMAIVNTDMLNARSETIHRFQDLDLDLE